MPTIPARQTGHEPSIRVFWVLFAVEAFRNALRWPNTPHWRASTLRAFGYAQEARDGD